MTKEELFEIIHEASEAGQRNYTCGTLDGSDFIIVSDHDDYQYLIGKINGFEGLTDKPYMGDNESLPDVITERKQQLNDELKNNPNHLGTHSRLKREIHSLQTWILYNQYLATNNIEPITLNDIEDIDYGFNDEYSLCGCGSCNNIVRTSPDCYEWQAPYLSDTCGYISNPCSSSGDFDDEILEACKNKEKALPETRSNTDLELVKINDDSFEHGWHPGQNDTPQPIITALNNASIDVWFRIAPSQFYVEFDVLVKTNDVEKATTILNQTNTKLPYEPADILKQQLQSAPLTLIKQSKE